MSSPQYWSTLLTAKPPPPVCTGMPSAMLMSCPWASQMKHEKSCDWLKIGLRAARRMMMPISRAMLSSLRSRTVIVILSSTMAASAGADAGEPVVAKAIDQHFLPGGDEQRGRRLLDHRRAREHVAGPELPPVVHAGGNGGDAPVEEDRPPGRRLPPRPLGRHGVAPDLQLRRRPDGGHPQVHHLDAGCEIPGAVELLVPLVEARHEAREELRPQRPRHLDRDLPLLPCVPEAEHGAELHRARREALGLE